MKFSSARAFRRCGFKNITLLGMSGIGKTHLSCILSAEGWFHYSSDYRIATAWLKKWIDQSIEQRIASVLAFKHLFDSNVRIDTHFTITDLSMVSKYIGRLGDPSRGGVDYHTFVERQRLYCKAEVAALTDAATFAAKARKKGFISFVNDAGGSLCEIEDSGIFDFLALNSLILHIRSNQSDRENLIERAKAYPKPLYFSPEFLSRQIKIYLRENHLEYIALIDPDALSRWIFPRLIAHRDNLYNALGDRYGYTVDASDVRTVRDSRDFIDLVARSVDSQVPCQS